MATAINLGSRYVLDETLALQTAGEDDDVLLSALPASFHDFLFGPAPALSLSDSFATLVGAAHSTTSITITSPGPVSALTLNDKHDGVLDGDDSGIVTLAGNGVFLYATDDPHIVIGREGNGTTASATGDIVFAIYLDSAADNKSATLWTVQFEAIQHPIGDDSHDEVVDLGQNLKIGVAGDFEVNLGTLKAGQLLFGSFGDADNGNPNDQEIAVICIAKDQSTSDGDGKDSVNTSKAAGAVTIGVSNQMFDNGEGAYFTFVNGMAGTVDSKGAVTLPSAGANEVNGANKIVYNDLVSSEGASFTIVQVQAGGNSPKTNVRISAFTTAEEQGASFVSGLTNDTAVDIDLASVKVFLNGVEVTNVIKSKVGMVVTVQGVPEGASVRYQTVDANGDPADHNRVLIENANGSPFDIGGFALVAQPTYAFIGQMIGFGDDGPTADINLTSAVAIADESVGADSGDTGLAAPDDEVGNSATLVAGATLIGYDNEQLVEFGATHDGGTDGSSSSVVSLVLKSANSGLSTTDGTAISLAQLANGDIVGSAGGVAVFALSIDQSGNVLVEQYDSIEHSLASHDDAVYLAAGSVFAKVVVSDGDTDAIADEVDLGGRIGFEDDGPTASLALNAVLLAVDESVGSDPDDVVGGASNAAADDEIGAPAGAIGYAARSGADLFAISGSSGEDDEGATSEYSLRLDSATTALRVSSSNALITLFQLDAQTIQGRYSGTNIAFTMTIDPLTGAVALAQFMALEHPTIGNFDEALALGTGKVSAVLTVTDGDGDVASDDVDIGAIMSFEDDGPSIDQASVDDLQIANVLTTASGALIFDGGSDSPAAFAITDASSASSGLTFAYADKDGDGDVDANYIIGKLNGVDLYSLFLDADGTYDFTLLSRIPGSETRLDLNDIKAGGPDTNFILVGSDTSDVVKISGFFDADGAGSNPRAPAAVNESHFNVGVKNGNLDANETLSISLYDATVSEKQDITGISIGTKTAAITHYTYTCYDDGVAVTGMVNIPITVGKNGTININAPAGVMFDTVDLVSIDGSAVKIGLGDIVIRKLPPDLGLEFDISLVDADGDMVTASFNVAIDGNGDDIYPAAAFEPLAFSPEPVEMSAYAKLADWHLI